LSHASAVHPYPDAVKVREPVARPLDVVAVELLLSASQAFLVGVLMYLAIGVWDDRGVGLGSVAVILALLGLAVGGSWLYWLLGGVGWPLAAANVPVAMFLGFALVLGWSGDDLFRVAGVPLLLGVLAAVYGIVGGVFVESPRRWRWDQRQKLRPGTQVPRVSETTQALVAAMPRSLPRRTSVEAEATSGLAARIEQSAPHASEPTTDTSTVNDRVEAGDSEASKPEVGEAALGSGDAGDPPGGSGTGTAGSPDETDGGPPMPTHRLKQGVHSGEPLESAEGDDEESGTIELPTAIEPRAQRSPWAWAAPPEWNRDEDDEHTGGRA
jgi:hypothetical protein